ncbi:hypothetical protein FYK55_20075 [Roseiconus nitratireducens]|uniref:Uncharacterized protein n=1 Tax=Roseiconus nitratireducens TaxID=2605748 RepID=A0A5M6CZN6_9BACT|nr:hypothetical protein [Roseiconus nitratireducens]KAA5540691.1 hypothetical protein FYK55_20075 [Roseiconus nitratireducens]
MGRRLRRPALAFTILEVLIALTASLLLMLGLARAYKLLGDKITEQQSELDLSSKLRDIALRLRDELLRATCEMTPPAKDAAAEGYLVYHEGPFTDSTTILGSVPHPTPRTVTYFPDSRFGDIDDFLAFTSQAKDGAPFVGFIPRGVLDAKRFANGQMTGIEITNYTNIQATQLVPFYSDVAEIAYWLSPQWERNGDGSLLYENQTADGSGAFSLYPVYRDRNDDLLPDRLRLHRRVLLIRPDLNMTQAEMNSANGATAPTPTPLMWNVPTVPFLRRNGSGALEVVPISDTTGSNRSIFPDAGFVAAPGLWLNGSNAGAQNTAAPHWLAGVGRIQQVMDLSISRVTDYWSPPVTGTVTPPPTFGMPTALLKANSLAQLSRPENRFAHVRIPHQLISGSQGSSMPQIALCPPHPYLSARSSTPPVLVDPSDPLMNAGSTPTTFPSQADHVVGTPPGGTPYLNEFGRFTMTTFLRPEFNLADRVSDFGAGGTSVALVNRGGSDVIADDVVGFDVQVFDPAAPRFIWVGGDGVPGAAGDDDGDGVIDNETELGWPGTDDEVVTVNDPRIDEALVNNGNKTQGDWYATPTTPFFVVDQGDFVDVGYPRLAGGPMRGLAQFDESGTLLTTPNLGLFCSGFSGLLPSGVATVNYGTTPTPLASQFQSSWEQSGRMIVSSSGGLSTVSSFYQPVYDTWTDTYTKDVFDQEGSYYGSFAGNPFAFEVGGYSSGVPGYTERRVAQNNSGTVSSVPRPVSIRRWSSFDGAISNEGEFVDQNAGSEQTPNNLSTVPIGLTPPIRDPLRAIKISIRVNDVDADTIRQQTVIQDF